VPISIPIPMPLIIDTMMTFNSSVLSYICLIIAFFLLKVMTKQLFDPAYGMFKYYEESRLLWFNSTSLDTQEYEVRWNKRGVSILQ
jgi:hypothetical protein